MAKPKKRAERPEFKRSDYATEAEATAALRARMGEAQFRRFDDQADGRDIVGAGECPPLKELLEAARAAAAERDRLGTSQDRPPKAEHERDPALGKKT